MTTTETLKKLAEEEYKWGFSIDLDTDTVPRGLSEDIVRLISQKKKEPAWLLEWRLKAYRHWTTMREPKWAKITYGPIDYQGITYYSAPKPKGAAPKNLEEVDPAFAGLDLVRGSSRELPIHHVLVNTRDDSGHCASALVSRMS